MQPFDYLQMPEFFCAAAAATTTAAAAAAAAALASARRLACTDRRLVLKGWGPKGTAHIALF